jgi:hypothetical protein
VIGDFQPLASDALLDWALAYTATGVWFFPVGTNNRPLTERGQGRGRAHDAARALGVGRRRRAATPMARASGYKAKWVYHRLQQFRHALDGAGHA